jgi:uncharacterized protein (DUF924 family)
MTLVTSEDVLAFWFGSPVRDADDAASRLRRWFKDGPALDEEVRLRFGATIEAALRGELDGWATSARGRLALVIVLDQLTRHAFRGTPRAWAGDPKAQALTLEAIERGMDADLGVFERIFLGMPLAHAEDLDLQRRSIEYGARIARTAPAHLAAVVEAGREQRAKYESIIARFGRFPFRNAVLGRATTSEESAFLADFDRERHVPRLLRRDASADPRA